MKLYKKVLVALQLDSKCDEILLKRALEIKKQFNGQLILVHAVEHLANYGAAYGIAAGLNVEEVLLEEAQKTMAKLAQQFDVDKKHQIVKFGPAKQVILEEAENLNLKSDLIIIGSHGRHGVRLLLGSTANAVLHSAKCDVLAIRVYE